MNNIYNAFNVQNEFELTKLIESFDLNNEEETELYSSLNESMSVDGIRYIVTELTKKYDNGSYEKLQEQLSKKPFKRTLKENNTPSLEQTWKNIVIDYRNLGYGDYDDDDILRIYHNVYGFLSAISNNFFATNKKLDMDADSIGTYFDDEVINEFRRQCNNGSITYFGDYSNEEDMLENGTASEMFEALESYAKKELVEKLVTEVNNFIQENEGELFNPNFDEPKKIKQPEDTGDEWLEENANNDWFSRLEGVMKELKSTIDDMGPNGKVIKDIANNDDDSEDDILDTIFVHFATMFFRLNMYMHYNPARIAISKINASIREIAPAYLDMEDEEETERWVDMQLNNGNYMPVISKFGIDGKYDLCIDIYDLAKELYNQYLNRDSDDAKPSEAPKDTGDDWLEENYDVNKEPLFDIGDEVSFKWGDKEVTGRIIGSKMIGSNEYFDIVSYNTERKRRENYTQVCPVSNEMKKINEGEF